MAAFSHHEPCPKCGSRDNLGVWKDGHKFCFGCHYYVPGEESLAERAARILAPIEITDSGVDPLPRDTSREIGEEGLIWLKKYGITDDEISSNNILWSERNRQLVFPVYGPNGILSWQARNFDPERSKRRKYYTSGAIDEVVHIISTLRHDGHDSGGVRSPDEGDVRKLVLVEDMVSAIKVARYVPAMPLFGSYISQNRLNRIRKDFLWLVVWLDWDKIKKASESLLRASMQGFKVDRISTELDPKALSDREIKQQLGVE